MTEKANPSRNRPAEAFKTAGAIAYGGHGGGGFVVDGASPTDISTQDAGIDETALNAFQETSSTSSFDVTIDPGEAFVFGSWIAIDVSTTVTLASSTTGQTVYAGWNKDGANDVIVGLDSAFSNATGDTDEKVPIWTFDTDGSGVIAVTDERRIGFSVEVEGEATFGTNDDVTVSYDSGTDSLDIDGANLELGGVRLFDEAGGYVPQTTLQNDSVTVNTGASLTNGGTVALGSSISIDHEDTSNQGNVSATDGAAITDLDLNDEGHVTNIGTTDFDSRYDDYNSWSVSDNSSTTDILSGQSLTLLGGTDISTLVTSTGTNTSIEVNHGDTSSQGDVFAGDSSVIDDIDVDGNGHVTTMNVETRNLNDWNTPNDFNINSAARMGLPLRSSDPTASAGDIWYRSDLD